MEKRMLTATDLMKYVYCPRIIYFIYILKRSQMVTKKEEKGIQKESDFQRKGKRTKVVKNYPKLPKMMKVSLTSENLGIKTIADSIMINEREKEAYPIQAKYAYPPRSIYKTYKLQLAMEAMIIEERMGYNVPYGFIKFLRSGELIKVMLHDSLKLEVMKSFGKIGKILSSETIPRRTKYRKRCTDCCFKNICW